MKLKTALLLFGIPLLVAIPYFFFTMPENRATFSETFSLFGWSVTVQSAFLVCMAMALILPALYFTRLFWHMRRYVRELETESQANARERDRFNRLEDLLADAQHEAVIAELAEVGTRRELLLKARAFLAADQPEAAVQLLAEPFDASGEPTVGYLLAEAQQAMDTSPEDVWQRLAGQKSNAGLRAQQFLYHYYRRHHRWQAALASLDALRKQGVTFADDERLGLRLLLLDEDSDRPLKKRIDGIQKILKERPKSVPANVVLGDAYMEQGTVDKAFRIYEQAFFETGHPVFLDRLDNHRMARELPEEAIGFYRQALVKQDTPLLKFRLGRLYAKLEMLDEALDILTPLAGKLGKEPAYLTTMAELEIRRHRLDDAVDHLHAVIHADDVIHDGYRCDVCAHEQRHWQQRCEKCDAWNRLTAILDIQATQALDYRPQY